MLGRRESFEVENFRFDCCASLLCQGLALAGFGGSEDAGEGEETVHPLGSPGGEWIDEETVELTLGPGAEPLGGIEPMMDFASETLSVPGEFPGSTEAYPGATTNTKAYSLTTWKPSQGPVGAYPMATVTPSAESRSPTTRRPELTT